ncbi:MAG: branched-chain amino acid ABC transporter permease [Alphaproteobacteria bacterium]|jgi:branched-chain amino acid transport system permease protein|nr:branched-chain amino acid ABC transporter permease [Alphaproteobacteria bacterium]MDP6255088.1 branched-chain amino acid ABC transporter permease [Alphaproteobacteria bacterium]MDP7053635.1 branched-chain amino acid ABC transporter permease [Alphaproteobacteria bacterium]MDP7228794.1 branched-chain amino acid ABC transporter permease [Alphaproteobacteria bacterium]MDP7459598.1 branched-chain amino acid ABC transporter permease [Alphaproteobacteria bacterium]|tara:strand:- start:1172 stop:2185 length:1014 start_codon:yes stop_codon:yes gene_type:complete
MNSKLLIAVIAAILVSLPFLGLDSYPLHLVIVILIWSFAYTGWSIMGRFGLVSLGHGAFMAIGGYVTALLWNELSLTPWIGIPVAMLCAGGMAVLIGYPCFKFRIVGHYFALVTLALSEVVRQVIIATRDTTGGSLGYTPERHGDGWSVIALQSDDRMVFYFAALAVWMAGIVIWRLVDRSMARYALEAISEEEDASAAVGVRVTREKLKVTVLSAVMTAFAGAMYCQYQMFISPDTIGGVGISLQIVFAVVVGGIYNSLGPTVGAVITLLLAEVLRIWIGTSAYCVTEKICLNVAGVPLLVYGIMLILFIIFLPRGIVGACADRWRVHNNSSVSAK